MLLLCRGVFLPCGCLGLLGSSWFAIWFGFMINSVDLFCVI